MIHSDDVERILLEIALGKPGPIDEIGELATLRAQLQKECAVIRANGGEIAIPHEIPDL